MSSSGSFQTRRLEKFNRTYGSLIKTHYRKNRRDREAFEKQLDKYLSLLRSNPRPPAPFGRRERWPQGSYREGWELWKLDFDMPGLGGEAKHGRLIYMFATEGSTIYLLWVYTHAEFKGRPPEKSLKELTKEAVEDGKRRRQGSP